MIDKIALWALLAGMAALWVWNWNMLKIIERHERQIKELQARSLKRRIDHGTEK